MLYDIIVRSVWKLSGKRVYFMKSLKQEEVKRFAANYGKDFKESFMIIESQ